MKMSIEIPSDNDGFILLQCPLCLEFFKLTVKDLQSEDLLTVFCPFCGIVSENYFTKDVIELAHIMVQNAAVQEIHKQFKEIERKTKNNIFQFKVGKKPNEIYENRIESKIDDLIIARLSCCNKDVKINYLTKTCGYYCPYCGVSVDGN